MRIYYPTTRWLALLALAALNVQLSAFAQSYHIVVLGALPNVGFRSQAWGINNSGQVVGYATPTGAFLYSSGAMISLGTLPNYVGSQAYGINDSGQTVGEVHSGSVVRYRAFLYSGGVMSDLGALSGGQSYAYAINNHSQIVGYANLAGGERRAFLYSGGAMADLGTLGGNTSAAYGINDLGQVVGGSSTASGVGHAFLYQGGAMTDLGSLGGNTSQAWSINNHGQVVGFSSPPSGVGFHAFLYNGGTMTDLGTLGGSNSRALDINEGGQVVGVASTASGASHAFLYSDGEMVDLNSLIPVSSGWTLQFASAINDHGQITGHGYNPAGNPAAFLLTPIPEPTALALLALGASALLFRRRGAS